MKRFVLFIFLYCFSVASFKIAKAALDLSFLDVKVPSMLPDMNIPDKKSHKVADLSAELKSVNSSRVLPTELDSIWPVSLVENFTAGGGGAPNIKIGFISDEDLPIAVKGKAFKAELDDIVPKAPKTENFQEIQGGTDMFIKLPAAPDSGLIEK
ncbi:MAG: hypothetical protein RL208_230 [Pseudomonadota bacterium]|jgi:hypothetical protein